MFVVSNRIKNSTESGNCRFGAVIYTLLIWIRARVHLLPGNDPWVWG